jgi:hypothetical protein
MLVFYKDIYTKMLGPITKNAPDIFIWLHVDSKKNAVHIFYSLYLLLDSVFLGNAFQLVYILSCV